MFVINMTTCSILYNLATTHVFPAKIEKMGNLYVLWDHIIMESYKRITKFGKDL